MQRTGCGTKYKSVKSTKKYLRVFDPKEQVPYARDPVRDEAEQQEEPCDSPDIRELEIAHKLQGGVFARLVVAGSRSAAGASEPHLDNSAEP